jgi:SAM-dependent methyltransferase
MLATIVDEQATMSYVPFVRFLLLTCLAICACSHPSSPPPQPAHPVEPAHSVHHRDHDFRDAEQWAARFETPERLAWQKPAHVIELMQLQPQDVVADLGAGTGYFLPYLARAVPHGRVLALDVEPAMVDYMTKRVAREQLTNVEARAVRTDDPQLAPTSVNKILIVNTWHHIADRSAYAAKLYAALSACSTSPALLVIVDFTAESPIGPPVAERLAPGTVEEELRRAGFDVRIAQASLPHQYVIIGQRSSPAGCSASSR